MGLAFNTIISNAIYNEQTGRKNQTAYSKKS